MSDVGWTFFFGNPKNRGWLALQGVCTTAQCGSAFIALSRLDLSSANVIMFTSPAFTAMIACTVLKQKWRWQDSLVTAICIVGVIFVQVRASELRQQPGH